MKLAEDLPPASTTAAAPERNLALLLLIKDVTLTKARNNHRRSRSLADGSCMSIEVSRPPRASDACRTPPAIVERIRSLAQGYTDRQIADQLNSKAMVGEKGSVPLPEGEVDSLRASDYQQLPKKISARYPEGDRRGDGRYGGKMRPDSGRDHCQLLTGAVGKADESRPAPKSLVGTVNGQISDVADLRKQQTVITVA